MKAILFLAFLFSTCLLSAQTQRIKELIPQGDINASQYSKEQEKRNNQVRSITARINDDALLFLNDQVFKTYQVNEQLNKISAVNITCMQVITDQQQVASYTKDQAIRTIILIETKK